MRIVIDTNVLGSGFLWGGNPKRIIELWAEGKFYVIASPEILWEYESTLSIMGKQKPELVKQWINFIYEKVHIVVPDRKVTVCRDPKDNMFLECAACSQAIYIVSGDKDLLVLKSFESTEIINPSTLVSLIK